MHYKIILFLVGIYWSIPLTPTTVKHHTRPSDYYYSISI